jgi:hypothetical protein
MREDDDSDLFSAIDGGTPDCMADRFKQFHRDNPRIYDYFAEFTMQALEQGYKFFGARMIWEKIRWEVHVVTKSSDGLKMNDHYVPFYARMFMRLNPQHGEVFATRRAQADAA